MGEIKYFFTLQGVLTILQGLSENEKYMPKRVVCWVSSLACNKAVQINGLLIQVLLPVTVALGIEAYYSHSNSPVPFLRVKRNWCWLWKNSQYFGEVFSPSLFPIASRLAKNKPSLTFCALGFWSSPFVQWKQEEDRDVWICFFSSGCSTSSTGLVTLWHDLVQSCGSIADTPHAMRLWWGVSVKLFWLNAFSGSFSLPLYQ